MSAVTAGYICLLTAGMWIGRLLKNQLMDDVFNEENESFMQETRLMVSEYSVNLPTRFYYKKKWHDGWINVVNPFRATLVLGTPGSGKSYAVINNYIRQQIAKGLRLLHLRLQASGPEYHSLQPVAQEQGPSMTATCSSM